GRSKSSDGQWCGRTDTNHVVNFIGADTLQPGKTVQVVIEEACLNSLRGRLKKH
ncbi:MAG: TRAM domain-containing protein, partial [Desulfobulbaceae bacterium]|nr:TRAM domain-containing protein [Desulfobulbaceae bacterium]